MDVKSIDEELIFLYEVVPYLQNYKGVFNQASEMSKGCGSHSQFHGAQFGHPALTTGIGHCSWAATIKLACPSLWCGETIKTIGARAEGMVWVGLAAVKAPGFQEVFTKFADLAWCLYKITVRFLHLESGIAVLDSCESVAKLHRKLIDAGLVAETHEIPHNHPNPMDIPLPRFAARLRVRRW